jgi:hypothetical protein
VSATGIRRLHEIACAAYAQQPLSRAEIDALFAHLRNLPRQNRMTRIGDLFSSAPHSGVATRGQAEPPGLGTAAPEAQE